MLYRKKKTVFNANSVDPDQAPHSAASDLSLHCLTMSLLWETGYKWIKMITSDQQKLLPYLVLCSSLLQQTETSNS